MRPRPPIPFACERKGPGDGEQAERLITLSLALEDALARECWDEADTLFAARDSILAVLPAHAFPREVDDIDARILARLQRGQAEIRRETATLVQTRHAAAAYGAPSNHSLAQAA